MAPSNRQPSASPAFLDSDSSTETPSRPVHQLNAQSLAFVENQYALYVHDPNSVSPDWREYFDEIHADHDTITPEILQAPFQQGSIFHRSGRTAAALPVASDEAVLQEKLDQLIRNYRVRGHIISQIDPLQAERPSPPELDPAYYGLTEEHLNREFSTQLFGGPEKTHPQRHSGLAASYLLPIDRCAVHAYRQPAGTNLAAGSNGKWGQPH